MIGKKHLLILSLTGCLLQQAAGQSVAFNERFDTFGQMLVQDGWAVELAQDSGILAIHMSYFNEAPWQYLLTTVSRHTPSGELISVAHSPLAMYSTYCGWANCTALTAGGGVVVGGSTYHPGDIQRAALIFFDNTGAFDTMMEYQPDQYGWIGRQARQTPDGGFVLCGETTSTGYVDGFLLKTNPQGELEWVQTYGGPSYRDFVMTVDLSPDGGYYLGGQKELSPFSFDPWVLRVDSLGEIIWDNTYGSPFDDGPNAHLTTMADGLPIFAGGLATSSAARNVPCLVKITSNGDVAWERRYGEAIANTTLFAVKEIAPGGDLIAAGQHYLSNVQVNSMRSGTLLRTTSEGDSLWMRFYHYHDADVAQGRGTLRDVLPTPDGGFIAVGTASSTPIHDQDLWLVKVDEYGCLVPGCNIITGMETQITNLREALKVWPNPVVQGGTVQMELQLPENFKPEGTLRLSVVGSDGRLVREEYFTDHSSPLTLHTSFAAGLYHLHLSDNTRWISGAKLVVE